MSEVTQQHRPFAIATSLGEDALLFHRMIGCERLGENFEYTLELLSERDDLNINDILGDNVTLRVSLRDGETRYFNGFVSAGVVLENHGRYARYQITLRPWLWFLTRTTDCRIFQDLTVPQIVEKVFRSHGFAHFEASLFGEYQAREYCVQYRETDFNFVSRLMEQAGIYFHFRHENGRHVLILCDDYSSHESCDGYEKVPYFPFDGAEQRACEHLFEWHVEHHFQPTAYALSDFDFARPRAGLGVSTATSATDEHPELEVYDYPGGYLKTEDGERHARIRLESLHARQEFVRANGDVRGLLTGGLFELCNFPRDDQNREHLVTSLSYDVQSDDYGNGRSSAAAAFRMELTAIDARRVYRTLPTTDKPVIAGPQTATVVGPADKEIWTDEHGRVKVQFHWDRYGKADQNSSCWMRVAQTSAGKRWGAVSVPRIGQEVIVDFIEGDPDHPVVTGRLYNGACGLPYSLPGNATVTTFKSNSSEGGGGFNELRFQDRKDEEQVFLHAQKDLDVRVGDNSYETVQNDRHVVVDRDHKEHVKVDRHSRVDRDVQEKIGRDCHSRINGKQAVRIGGSNSLTVHGDMVEIVKKSHCHEVSESYYLKAMDVVVESLTGITLKCGASSIVIDPVGVTITGPAVVLDGAFTRVNSGPGSAPAMGESIRAVCPAAPETVVEADVAAPGDSDRLVPIRPGSGSDDLNPTKVRPFVPPGTDDPVDPTKTWVEIELVDEDDRPIPGEPFQILLPDGTLATGTTDVHGIGRIAGVEPGECQVSFHKLDEDAWEKT